MSVSLIVVVAAALFVSWMIGANSVSTSFGPVAGSGASGVLRGALLAGIFGLVGAIVQGDNVAGTVGSDILSGATISAPMASVILLSAAVLVVIGVYFQIPIPLAFTVVGSVLGAGLGLGATWDVGEVRVIAATWIAIPFVAVILGYGFARVLRKYFSKDGSERPLSLLLFFIAGFTAYTAGANLVGLAVGPLVSIIDVSIILLLLIGGIVIMFGAWLGGPRIVNAVSKDYSAMGMRRSICALSTATVIAQSATLFGIPVSFNEVIIASMIGSGLVAGTSEIRLSKIGKTVFSWVGSFAAAMAISWVVMVASIV